MAKPLTVSDHAALRFLQRAGLVDLGPVKAGLERALQRSFAAAASIDQHEFLILAGGLVYVVRDATVVTVVPEDGRHRHPRRISGLGEID